MAPAPAGRATPRSLTVLGCDGSWTGPGGAGSGYLVESPRARLLVDAGPGTFAVLQEHLDPSELDAVIVSHRHDDHWSDLVTIDTHARYASGRTGLPVFAPEGLAEHARLLASPSFEWHPVAPGEAVQIGDLTVTFRRTDHGVETLAVRIEGGDGTLGYSADTGPGWALSELGTGLDLVLCEATYTEEHEGTARHMSGRQAGAQARSAQAQRLVVTHRWPTIEAEPVVAEARSAFGGPVEPAEPRRVFRW